MLFQKYRPVLEVAGLSVLAFLCHSFLLSFFGQGKEGSFRYSLPQLYAIFGCCSMIIIFILIKVKQKNIDSVGNTFMLLTCLKLVLAYGLLHPILNSDHPNIATEKANFFIVFAVFLTLETLVAIRLLNKS